MLFAGKYELEERLGEGAMGVVYRARHTLLGLEFAVKVLHPQYALDPTFRARFLREARLPHAFVHKRSVTLREFGVDEHGTPYLSMDLCPGNPLAVILRQQGRLDPRRAVRIAMQVLEVLEEAHAAGILHRDIKPDNIMVDSSSGQDQCKVMDFGIAKIMAGDGGEVDLTRGHTIGTPLYMSPEQAAGERLDGRSDLYSLGVVLYEMMAGWPPFTAENVRALLMKHITQAPPPLPLVDGLTPLLEAVVARALAKSPVERFAGARELRQALQEYLEGHHAVTATVVAPRVPVPAVPPPVAEIRLRQGDSGPTPSISVSPLAERLELEGDDIDDSISCVRPAGETLAPLALEAAALEVSPAREAEGGGKPAGRERPRGAEPAGREASDGAGAARAGQRAAEGAPTPEAEAVRANATALLIPPLPVAAAMGAEAMPAPAGAPPGEAPAPPVALSDATPSASAGPEPAPSGAGSASIPVDSLLPAGEAAGGGRVPGRVGVSSIEMIDRTTAAAPVRAGAAEGSEPFELAGVPPLAPPPVPPVMSGPVAVVPVAPSVPAERPAGEGVLAPSAGLSGRSGRAEEPEQPEEEAAAPLPRISRLTEEEIALLTRRRFQPLRTLLRLLLLLGGVAVLAAAGLVLYLTQGGRLPAEADQVLEQQSTLSRVIWEWTGYVPGEQGAPADPPPAPLETPATAPDGPQTPGPARPVTTPKERKPSSSVERSKPADQVTLDLAQVGEVNYVRSRNVVLEGPVPGGADVIRAQVNGEEAFVHEGTLTTTMHLREGRNEVLITGFAENRSVTRPAFVIISDVTPPELEIEARPGPGPRPRAFGIRLRVIAKDRNLKEVRLNDRPLRVEGSQVDADYWLPRAEQRAEVVAIDLAGNRARKVLTPDWSRPFANRP